MNSNQKRCGHLIALITIIIWGITFVSTKVLLKSFTPVEILFTRFVLGFAALLAIYPKRIKIHSKHHELYFAAAGLCGITLYYLLENIALTYTFASNVGVIVSTAPFFTAIAAHIFLKGERLQIRFFIGFIIAIIGVLLICFNTSSEIHINPAGDILALLAAAVWAVYSILVKKISGFQYNTIQATRRIFFYGLIFMLPALFISGFSPDLPALAQPVNLFNILFLGLGASALCFVTWGHAVNLLGATKASAYIYMVPVITIIISIIILHEKLTTMSVIGITLTLAGLLLSESNAGKKTGRHSSIE